jgi:recombination protein RecT
MTEKALTNIEKVKVMMNADTVKEQFRNALKDNASLFQASIIELLSNDSYLQSCDPKSILTAALTLATLKLPLNKSLGFAYLVPYKGTVQPQIGYKGLIQLAQRTGLYKCINAGPVFEGELKSVDKLSGEIDISGEKTGDNVIGYFAFFSTNYGFSKSIYWTAEEVHRHARRFSRAYKAAPGKKPGPWETDFDAMACKTVLKTLISHYGPMTIDIGDTIAKADGEDVPDDAFDIEIEPEKDGLKAFAELAKKESEPEAMPELAKKEPEPEIIEEKSANDIQANPAIETGPELMQYLISAGRKEEDLKRTLKSALEKSFEELKPSEVETAKKIFGVAVESINDFE